MEKMLEKDGMSVSCFSTETDALALRSYMQKSVHTTGLPGRVVACH